MFVKENRLYIYSGVLLRIGHKGAAASPCLHKPFQPAWPLLSSSVRSMLRLETTEPRREPENFWEES